MEEDKPPNNIITPEMLQSAKVTSVNVEHYYVIPDTGFAVIRIDLLKELIKIGIKNDDK